MLKDSKKSFFERLTGNIVQDEDDDTVDIDNFEMVEEEIELPVKKSITKIRPAAGRQIIKEDLPVRHSMHDEDSIEIEEVLTQQIIGRIACHANDMSYIVPISYVYDGECVYARTFEGLKINLMRKNPNVCFQTDVMENMANWKSVIAWGEFKEHTEDTERKEEEG